MDVPKVYAPDAWQAGTVVQNAQVDDEGYFADGIVDLKKPRPSWLWMSGTRDCYELDVNRNSFAKKATRSENCARSAGEAAQHDSMTACTSVRQPLGQGRR